MLMCENFALFMHLHLALAKEIPTTETMKLPVSEEKKVIHKKSGVQTQHKANIASKRLSVGSALVVQLARDTFQLAWLVGESGRRYVWNHGTPS